MVPSVVPFVVPAALSANIIRLFMSASMQASTTVATTGGTQFSYGLTRSHNFVIYSRGTGASSLSLKLHAVFVQQSCLSDDEHGNQRLHV